MIRRILLALAFAATLAAQTFIQMSDPQFGMFTENKGFEHETANFEFAMAAANRLKPAFVVLTGDLVNAAGDKVATVVAVKGNGRTQRPAWTTLTFAIPAALQGTSVAIQLMATDAGADATVEAGVDSLRITTP